MKIERTNLDSKGRIVIPKTFRDNLGLSERDNIFISLDEKNRNIIVSQYKEKKIYQIIIEMKDAPGTLFKLAKIMYENKIDLITTESHSVSRTNSALWRILCAMDKINNSDLKKKLKKAGAKSVLITKI